MYAHNQMADIGSTGEIFDEKIENAKYEECRDTLNFIDSMQEESEDDWKYSIAERLGVSKDEFDKMKPVSDDLEQAAKNCNANLQLQEYFKRGAQWQKNKQHQEPVSEDLEKAAIKYAQDKYMPVQTSQAFKSGAQWQKQQMMENAVDSIVHCDKFGVILPKEDLKKAVDNLPELQVYDKVKLLIIKED